MTLHWLVSRQTTCLEENEYYNLEDLPVASVSPYKPFHVLGAVPVLATDRHPDALAVPDLQELQWAGFNGRCNKIADTCYSWWVGGSLAVSRYQAKIRSDLLLTNAQDTAQSASYGLQWQSEIFVGKDAAHCGRFWQASRGTARYVLALIAGLTRSSLGPFRSAALLFRSCCLSHNERAGAAQFRSNVLHQCPR